MYFSVMADVHNWVTICCEYDVTAWMPQVIFIFTFYVYIDIYYDLLFIVIHTLFVCARSRKYYTQYIIFSSSYFPIFLLFFIYFPIFVLHFWKNFPVLSPTFFNTSPRRHEAFFARYLWLKIQKLISVKKEDSMPLNNQNESSTKKKDIPDNFISKICKNEKRRINI